MDASTFACLFVLTQAEAIRNHFLLSASDGQNVLTQPSTLHRVLRLNSQGTWLHLCKEVDKLDFNKLRIDFQTDL